MVQEFVWFVLPMYLKDNPVVYISQVESGFQECGRSSMNTLASTGDRVEPIGAPSVCFVQLILVYEMFFTQSPVKSMMYSEDLYLVLMISNFSFY